MDEHYNHKEVEPRVRQIWEQGDYFTPQVDSTKKSYSLFLTPPNASGGMHIGNVLMIAIQDILARYHRAKGESTLWIPGTDHGGYETQVTFERELEKSGKSRLDYSRVQLFEEIGNFVEKNNQLIKEQIKSTGASVDWSRFRYTMDESSLSAVEETFRKMVSDNLIYRRPYMVNYCSECGTILADIELKEAREKTPLYFVKFNFENSVEYLPLATARPEFLFAVTHVLVHPLDNRFAMHIGKVLVNPITGGKVEVVESKRKFDQLKPDPVLTPFSPSYEKYDYEYTLRTSIPSRNLLDWEGNMLERYPGLKPLEARNKEAEFLAENGFIEKTDDSYEEAVYLCKRGHVVESMIMLTWFLRLDDDKNPMRKPALESLKKTGLNVFPKWREKGLVTWLEKMFDWPIARQNVWGIRIPIWYDVSEPEKFTVWFNDKSGKRLDGNLKNYLDRGVSLAEISEGLERIYASDDANWTLNKEEGRTYLPETDTFDTWFSSGQWSSIVYGDMASKEFSYFYPCDTIVIGHDLLRLSVSRKILLGQYLTGRLPFRSVYLNRLILGPDGQKMSKSLGNSVPLEFYLNKFSADVTRMALVSYTTLQEDFVFSEDQLQLFRDFSDRLWNMGKIILLANQYAPDFSESLKLSPDDKSALFMVDRLTSSTGSYLDKLLFAFAQEKLCYFLSDLEKYAETIKEKDDMEISLSILKKVFEKYLILLHPFMPFMTEELYTILYSPAAPLATAHWPSYKRV